MKPLQYHKSLNATDLRALGIPEPWSFGLADRTRFSELDLLGHVNNASYLGWFETFRVQYFIDYRLAYVNPDGPSPVLRKIGVDFLAEMKLREEYIVTGRTTTMRTTSTEMEYAVWSGGTLRTTGYALLVFLNADGSRYTLSDGERDMLRDRDGAIDTR